MSENIYIIIVNYNGWSDTLECLESLVGLDYGSYRIVVVDNCSSDDSQERIAGYLEKEKGFKLLSYRDGEFCPQSNGGVIDANKTDKEVVYIASDRNGGFAYGNNIGIKYAKKNNFKAIWLLNNDTVVDSAALTYLVQVLDSEESVGMVGSLLCCYDRRNIIQSVVGRYDPKTGVAWYKGVNKARVDEEDYERIDYIIGASMLVSREFIEKAGLMCEDYFLYFEELDWAVRAKKCGFQLGFAPKSIVYHKEGASCGTSSDLRTQSEFSVEWFTRSRLLFTKKFYPEYYSNVVFQVAGSIIKNLVFGNVKRSVAMCRSFRRAPLPNQIQS